MVRCNEAREGVDRGEARVSRRDAVAADLLEVVQERDDVVGSQVAEVELDDRSTVVRREEPQEEHEGVAIAADRVRAHAADPRQVVGKELAQRAGEGAGRRFHRGPPEIRRQCLSNRSLAASATGSSSAR